MHFPELHPDELLLGYIGRVVRLNHVTRARLQSAVHDQFGVAHWTGACKTWSVPLANVLGISVPELLTGHTLEPLLRVQFSPVATDRFSPLDRSVLPAILRAELSVQGRQLRLCRACTQEDVESWGYSYWRRSHQIHGVPWCFKHHCGLLEVRDANTKDRFPEECEATARCHLSHMRWSPVQRFADICVGLLEIESRIPAKQTRYRMRRRASALNLRLSEAGSRTTVSDRVAEHFPIRWVVELIPTFRTRKAGFHLPAIDNVCRNGGSRSAGSAFALVLASLYGDADEALIDISRPLTEEEAEDMALTATPQIAGARGRWLIQRAKRLRSTAPPKKAPSEHQPWPFSAPTTSAESGSAC